MGLRKRIKPASSLNPGKRRFTVVLANFGAAFFAIAESIPGTLR
jgi:hypothetical protein